MKMTLAAYGLHGLADSHAPRLDSLDICRWSSTDDKCHAIPPGRRSCLHPRITSKALEKSIIMGLGVLEDKHLEHVPGTALLTDMLDSRQHRYHGE